MSLAKDAPLPGQMRDTMAQAIVQAFGDQSDLGEGLQQALSTGQPGLALLDALPLLALGAKGDPHSARQGLEVLRAVGLEQTARQIAIELLLIERRG
jgi:hypothetical protein